MPEGEVITVREAGGSVEAVASGPTDTPDEPLPPGPAGVATAAGVAAVWAGPQLAVVAAAIGIVRSVPPSATPHLWYAAALSTAVGLTSVSRRARRTPRVATALRSRSGAVRAGVAGGVALLLTTLVALDPSEVTAAAVATVAVVQLPLVAAWWRWSVPDPPPVPTRRTAVSALVVGLIVAHAALVPVRLPDAYPFAIYTMFSEPRLDPYGGERVVFVADEGTDRERELPRPASRLALLDLAHDDRVDDLEAIAGRLADRHGAQQVTVHLERVEVAPPPAPPRLEVAARTELVVSGG